MRSKASQKFLVTALLLILAIVMLPVSGTIRSQGPATPDGTVASPPEYTGPFEGSVVFGVPLALTGSLSKEGNLSHEGYELWKEVYNKAGGIVIDGKHYQIETKYYDDESN